MGKIGSFAPLRRQSLCGPHYSLTQCHGGHQRSWAVTCGGRRNKPGGSRLFRSERRDPDERWMQRASGGNRHVAYLEQHTQLGAPGHAGGVSIRGLVRASLHRASSLQRDFFSPIPWRGTCGADDPRGWRERHVAKDHGRATPISQDSPSIRDRAYLSSCAPLGEQGRWANKLSWARSCSCRWVNVARSRGARPAHARRRVTRRGRYHY
jgi:hypothetical protein